MTANLNRDEKQRREPFSIADFCLFQSAEDTVQPPAAAGAAMAELIRLNLLPAFALAFYKELSAVSKNAPRPTQLAWIGSDVLLLAPYRVDEQHWGGFLIAEAESAGQPRLMRSEDGREIWLHVPSSVATAGAVMAAEGSRLPICESQPAPHCAGPLPQRRNGSNPS